MDAMAEMGWHYAIQRDLGREMPLDLLGFGMHFNN